MVTTKTASRWGQPSPGVKSAPAENHRPGSARVLLLLLTITTFGVPKLHGLIIMQSVPVVRSPMGLLGLKSRYQQGCVPSPGSKGESTSLLLPDPRSRLHSLARGPSLQIKTLRGWWSFSHTTSVSDVAFCCQICLCVPLEGPSEDSGPIWISLCEITNRICKDPFTT